MPPDGVFTPLLSPALRCRSRISGPETSVNRDQNEQRYDNSNTQNSAARLPQAGSLEITARFGCRSRRAQSAEDGDSSPIAESDWDKGLRNMDVAGKGTGPWPGALARGRTAVAAGLIAGAGNSESAARIAAGQPKGERKPNVAAGDRNYRVGRLPHDRASGVKRSLARGVGNKRAGLAL